MVWNERDQRVPWVRKLGAIIGAHDQLRDPASVLERSPLFGEVEEEQFRSRQQVDQVTIKDLVLSRSNVATLSPEQREAKLAEVAALYADYGRGMDGMQLPYVVRCFGSQVLDRPASYSGTTETSSVPEETQPMRTSDGSETDMLLIDFR
jgi:hypothetical protein